MKINVFYIIFSVLEPVKFIAEQMAQLLYHITAAKAISSQVLAATPDPSHWRDSFERGVETLNYAKQVVQSLHPTGYNYPVYMDTFFNFHTQTGVITEGPRAKRRRTTSGVQSTQASAPSQEIEEQETQQTEPPQGPPFLYYLELVGIDIQAYQNPAKRLGVFWDWR